MNKEVNIYSFNDECYVYLGDYKKLQKENKILRENAENNDKVVDKVNWENRLLKQQNKKYKEVIDKAIEYIENHSLYETEYDYDYEENSYLSGIDDETAKKDLLEILKGSDEE